MHLIASLTWLLKVHGAREVYDLITRLGDQLVTDDLVSVDDG
jgi:hypothetical protein